MSRELPIGAFARAAAGSLMVALLALVAGLDPVPANAQSNVSARIEWYGVYTVSKYETVEDATSPTGSRLLASAPVGPSSNSDRIPLGRDKLDVGLSYVLSGNGGRKVTVREVYQYSDKAAGEKKTKYERVREREVGRPVLMGWSFEGASFGIGEWEFQVWAGGRLLLEKHFTLYAP
jgi:hypothetical protein